MLSSLAPAGWKSEHFSNKRTGYKDNCRFIRIQWCSWFLQFRESNKSVAAFLTTSEKVWSLLPQGVESITVNDNLWSWHFYLINIQKGRQHRETCQLWFDRFFSSVWLDCHSTHKKTNMPFFDSSHKYFSTLSASQRDGSCQSSSFLPSKHTTVNVSVCDGGIEKESEEATEQEVHPGLVCHLTSF